MKLIVVHYHWRPSGVRKVVETALPSLVQKLGITKLVLANGERIEPSWLKILQSSLGKIKLECFVDSTFSYLSEQRVRTKALQLRLQQALSRLLLETKHAPCVVWAHNLGIGRNLTLARELVKACEARQLRLILHHHDWWFDNRWTRWKEFRRSGFRTQESVAQTVFPRGSQITQVGINQEDTCLLERSLPKQTFWWPNPVRRLDPPGRNQLQRAQQWLHTHHGFSEEPIWLVPTRLLRRKNLAEAILLTRWLRPEAWLITTGGVSSSDERAYAQALRQAARKHKWQVKFGVLAEPSADPPSVHDLMDLSEVILLTSLQEGFGLPYLEAAASHRPLIARKIPNIIPDLKQFGFDFPQLYSDLMIDTTLFDWKAEHARQRQMRRIWLSTLPRTLRDIAGRPFLLESHSADEPVPFSRLSLIAQLEVLNQPINHSWEKSVPLNTFLEEWRQRAQKNTFQRTPWPGSALDWLSSEVYARRFAGVVKNQAESPPACDRSLAVQTSFIRRKLSAQNLFPLLW